MKGVVPSNPPIHHPLPSLKVSALLGSADGAATLPTSCAVLQTHLLVDPGPSTASCLGLSTSCGRLVGRRRRKFCKQLLRGTQAAERAPKPVHLCTCPPALSKVSYRTRVSPWGGPSWQDEPIACVSSSGKVERRRQSLSDTLRIFNGCLPAVAAELLRSVCIGGLQGLRQSLSRLRTQWLWSRLS